MSTARVQAATLATDGPSPSGNPFGKMFLGYWDVWVIGGGLSLLTALVVFTIPRSWRETTDSAIPLLALLFNNVHFSSSYLRLYTKPGAMRAYPGLSYFGPLALFLAATVFVLFSQSLGQHIHSLYLTWSPYHYAAQAFGLCMIYLHRSGYKLEADQRRGLKAIALLPFLYALVHGRTYGAGVGWFIPPEWFFAYGWIEPALGVVEWVLVGLTFCAPLVWGVRMRFASGAWVPLIVPLLLVSNAVWWIVMQYAQAFAWVTVFHALQYLGILMIFQSAEHRHAHPEKPVWVALGWFYGAALIVGYVLFRVWAYAFEAVGFGFAEASMMIVASLNVYHFIVDAFLWRLKNDSNERTLQSAPFLRA